MTLISGPIEPLYSLLLSYIFVPHRNEVVKVGYWITLCLSVRTPYNEIHCHKKILPSFVN